MKSSPHFAAKFGLSLARHDPSGAASIFFCILCDISATKNRKYKASDDAASPRTNLTRLSGVMGAELIAAASGTLRA
jgi:hypothetical protein